MNAEALSRYFAQASVRPARLGHFDCVRFVVEALLIGWDRDYRHCLEYTDRRSAVAQLRRHGGLMESLDAIFGQSIPATDLSPGDIAYFPDPCIGIILPDHALVKAWSSILVVPRDRLLCGWKT